MVYKGIFIFCWFVLNGIVAVYGKQCGVPEIKGDVLAEHLDHCGQALIRLPGASSGDQYVQWNVTAVVFSGGGDQPRPAETLDVLAAIEWEHVDLDVQNPKIDWTGESFECKAAYLALSCAYAFELCRLTPVTAVPDCGTSCQGWAQSKQMRLRLEDACTQNATHIWTKFYPNDGSLESSFDLKMRDDACMPDGTTGPGSSASTTCKKVFDEPCESGTDCWSGVCTDKKCVALATGEGPCFNEDSCLSGLCDRQSVLCIGLELSETCEFHHECAANLKCDLDNTKKCVHADGDGGNNGTGGGNKSGENNSGGEKISSIPSLVLLFIVIIESFI